MNGAAMMAWIGDLYPICRSITGEGLRQTLRSVAERVPARLHEIPSGTPVLDWTVPREWNLRSAWIEDASGRRVVDAGDSNLHVVNYSTPIRRRMELAELLPHLHSLPDHPDWIPYRTSYYREDWGFCLRHRDLVGLVEGEYEVCVDSTLEDGALTYAELVLSGDVEEEVLLTTHACHPSMANDNLSGIAVLTALAQRLQARERRFTYRLLWMPGTIGAITWLEKHRADVDRVRHGLVLAGLGDAGAFTYKRSRRGDAEIDLAVAEVLGEGGRASRLVDFSPYGYDERQFCSPAFDLPVGRFSRSEYGSYPEYHSSADDLGFVSAGQLEASVDALDAILRRLESRRFYRNTAPEGEPQLGRRGLYDETGEVEDWPRVRLALLWVLNLSDGLHSLESIAARSGLPMAAIEAAALRLLAAGLLSSAQGEAR